METIPLDTVLCGDCLEMTKSWPDRCVDLILTDPPYRADVASGGGAFGHIRDKVLTGFVGTKPDFNIAVYLDKLVRLCKIPNMYVWTSQKGLADCMDFARQHKLTWDVLVWVKSHCVPAKNGHHLPQLEYCAFMRDKGATFSNDQPFECYRKAIVAASPNSIGGHPTPKPFATLQPAILISSYPGDIILDPFCGGGSTLGAARIFDRHYIGIDINPKYVEMSRQTLEALGKQLSLFQGGENHVDESHARDENSVPVVPDVPPDSTPPTA